MCLILFAINQHPDLPLVLAANRDEFYQRPTEPMHWWDGPNVLAGRDRLSGGTWLAVSPGGLITAVTNVRDGTPEQSPRSRGELPLRAIDATPEELEKTLGQDRDEYAGYNLLRLSSQAGWYYSNRDAHPGRLVPRGVHGLSNHQLQTPWPKLLRTRERFIGCLSTEKAELHNSLIRVMEDDAPAPDHLLPDTGVGLNTERFLSSPFIRSDTYGTRATTICTLDRNGKMTVTEQGWGPGGKDLGRQTFRWSTR